MLMRASRLLAATLLCSVGVAGMTACGPLDSKSSAAAPSATPSPTETGLAALSAQDIIKKAQEASAKVTSAKLTFDIMTDGEHLVGSVAEDKSGACVGQISMGDKGKFDVLRSADTVWIKPDSVFWEKSIAKGSAKTMAGKYLKGKGESAGVKELAGFCDMGLQVLKSLGKNEDGSDDTAGANKAGTKQVGSVNAVVLTGQDGEDKMELAIAAEGEPYLLELSSKGKEPGSMTFSDFGQPVSVTPPKAALVIDASKYLKG
ncbi:lipoprotein [Kitasatospora atroaurantiaca]